VDNSYLVMLAAELVVLEVLKKSLLREPFTGEL
jgi:hypothetical protein